MSNHEENKKLLYDYLMNNNEESFKILIEKNINLVHFVINKLSINYNVKVEILEDEYFDLGCLALAHAIKKFDVNKIEEVKLSTYAIIWIEGKITRELKRKINQEENTVSMDQKIGDEDDLTIEGTIKDENDLYEDFIEDDYYKYKKEKIKEALSKFDDNEREIIELYYGFKDGEPKTYYRISVILGISRSRIKNIINSANEKLKKYLKEFNFSSNLEKKAEIKKQEIEINKLNTSKNKLIKIINESDRNVMKEIFNNIDNFEKKVVFMYCGINLKKAYDIKSICKELDLDEESVEDIIETTINKIANLVDKKTRRS